MRRRAGRKRKSGARYPSGDLRRPSPLEVAAGMPHRRALGKNAASQLAENELGRMVLRGEVDAVLATAGDLYRGEYRAYLAAICAPRMPVRALGEAAGAISRCVWCPRSGGGEQNAQAVFCLCADRERKWRSSQAALADSGASAEVERVCLDDRQCPLSLLWLLQVGLRALAHHYGLTRGTKRPIGKYQPSSLVET